MQKFSDKYINEWEILTKSIIGFEFEFYTERSYYKLLELLNRELSPVVVYGYKKYHSDMKPTELKWKIEPDLSGGPEMCELITGPLNYINARLYLLKILGLLQKYITTDEKCSLHINISFDKNKTDNTIDKVNPLKIILNINEETVYKFFPERENNFYAMSVKNIIPYKDFDFIGSGVNIIENNIEIPDSRYYGININTIRDGRLEFRYIGDVDYHKKTKEILELMDYFILLSWNSITEKINDDDRKILIEYLNKNINNFKKFKNIENFISEFPTIRLEIDKDDSLLIVKSYYGSFYDKLYDLIMNTYNLGNCIINFDTNTKMLEVVDADFKAIIDINGIKFINCSINTGRYEDCEFITCNIKNAHINKSVIKDSDIFNCKLEHTDVDETSIIRDSYFYGGLLNGEITGDSVFRSGKVGEYGIISKSVKIISDVDNYFGIRYGEIDKEKPIPKGEKSFKKF